MELYAWKLSSDGKEFTVIKIDSLTRRVTDVMRLPRKTPMTEADAQKYFNDNYPREGSSVRLAAEILGTKK